MHKHSPIRRTKIIATLGPATDNEDMLEKIIAAGVDVVRMNFSHGTTGDHARRIAATRKISIKLNKEIGVLVDLQGPKIRVARFKEGSVTLKENDTFILDANLADDAGDQQQVGIDYKGLPNDVSAGDKLLLDDGRLVMQVIEVAKAKIICQVEVGGKLLNNKGINRQGGGLSADALTDKDRRDITAAASLGVDYFAISFPRCAADMHEAKKLLQAAGTKARIIAKIERKEAVDNIEELIDAADVLMVARGDLGVEIGDAEVPGVQKQIIHQARQRDKAVITATQMMESMITNIIPTRAEVSDVANAVLDGTDAVMLSAETATGLHPDKVVATMARVCLAAESQRVAQVSHHRMHDVFERTDEAIAMATMYTANHLDIKAIITLTESGSTPLWMSRIRSGIPIYAFTRYVTTQRRMTIFRGVYPVAFDITQHSQDDINRLAVAELEKQNIIHPGDLVIITKGDILGVHGGSNLMKIVEVGGVV